MPKLVLFVTVLCLLVSRRSPAQEIQASQEGCPDLNLEEITRLMAIELADLAKATGNTTDFTIRIICEDQSLRIVADDSAESKHLERSIAPLETNLKERVIALSASQLVTVSWLEKPAPKEAVVEEPASPQPQVREDELVEHLELSLAGGFKLRSDFAFPVGVAGLRGDVWFEPYIGLLALASFDGGTVNRDIGNAPVLCALTGLGLSWRFIRTRHFGLEATTIALAGYGYIEGNPRAGARGRSSAGITGEFVLALTPTLLLGNVFIALDLQGGYTIKNPIGRVDGDEQITAGGFWTGANLRVGLAMFP
ncbi:MAG: hypothetical protein GY854_31205 [Deltaproteobacteria bacterium]|nr:hypothetical protein [Deltaproteobacteria bacterium]